MEVDEADELYADFGSPVGLAEGRKLGRGPTATEQPLAAAAGAGGAALPEPPLVQVQPGAADLYSDLFDSGGAGGTLLKTQVAELTDRVQRQEAQIAGLQQQVGALTEQNGELSERCTTLTANISALYNTAKLELQRKDGEIRELRERLAGTGRGKPPAPVAPPRPSSGAAQAQQHRAGGDSGRRQGSVERQGSGSREATPQRQQSEEERRRGQEDAADRDRRPRSSSHRDEGAQRHRSGSAGDGRREERHGGERDERHRSGDKHRSGDREDRR